ncbi:cyclohexanecarboxylate-CoA ligase [Alicyclobacillus cellulosilyticus]|uniref:Cyclohexanecarboxylate-CoA ligase n=1 Tax=Alicyclobacillus cellulosilyticus TaxID=1003997 RepID=A0A917KI32_9BACL|nr:AMP-binding protein [Alicyclobacillus cellulosilyticus]GGJ12417.1 cyclohexanecarboxylate-CoA ligase [Alicyclobacillus cellulosilyticus]
MNWHHVPTVLDKLDEAATRFPDRLAIVDLSANPVVKLTYGELDMWANRLAQGLLDAGVAPGEHVTYQLPNGWEFVVLTVALWRIGAVPCPLLPQLRDREVRFILQSSGARRFFIPDEFRNFRYLDMVERIRGDLPNLAGVYVLEQAIRQPGDVTFGGLLAPVPDLAAIRARRPDRHMPAQLFYTSGTTGEPKGVIHTHHTLAVALALHCDTLGLGPEDTVWIPTPLAHQTGFLYGMMLAFFLGAASVYQAVWNVDVARVAIEEYGVRFVQAATPFLADLTRATPPPKGLKLFVAAGAAIPRQLAYDARRALACSVVGGWGSTESCLVTVGFPGDPEEKLWGTDGRVIPGMEIKIVDEQGNPVPPGVEGRFFVRTPAMFVGYLNHPEWYAKAVGPDGFYDTGDLAVQDEDGYIRLTGRQKDIVNRGGEKVPVVEVENLLYQHPKVLDVAIVAMPDPRLVERACAYVVPKNMADPPTLAELTAFLQEKGTAKIYWPERLEIIDALPRTASGKVQKYKLREMIAAKLAAEQGASPAKGVHA